MSTVTALLCPFQGSPTLVLSLCSSTLDLRVHPNVEPHTVRPVGDTDNRTKFETGAPVPNRNGFEAWRALVEENADTESKIRDVASCVAGGHG